MQDQLEGWWRSQLTAELRDRLVVAGDRPLPADLALDVWRRSGRVHAVDHLGDHVDGWEWRLTPEVAAFIRDRTTADRVDDDHVDDDRAPATAPRPLERSHGQS